MLKNIHVTELKPGMRVVDPGIDWRTRPYLYASEQFIDSENTIQQILAQGYREVYVDLALSGARSARPARRLPETAALLEPAVPHRARHAAGRRVALREELPQALQAYGQALKNVRQLMAAVTLGRFHAGMAEQVAHSLMRSLERNPDALLCLAFMRQLGPYVCTHCVNVSILLAAWAMTAGKDESTVMAYALAGLLHDLGKGMLPVSLVNARRTLKGNEIKLMRMHPLLAHKFLSSSCACCPEALTATLEHHERYDGSGYPRGLCGRDISEIGQIAGIADTYDAISSRRPYKEAVNPHKSLGLLYTMRKKEFHPKLVEQFVCMLGIYPVGSVVELQDGYRGVVFAGNIDNPAKPSIILVRDPQGKGVPPRECDLAKDTLAGIARYIPAELSGIDPCAVLGLGGSASIFRQTGDAATF